MDDGVDYEELKKELCDLFSLYSYGALMFRYVEDTDVSDYPELLKIVKQGMMNNESNNTDRHSTGDEAS